MRRMLILCGLAVVLSLPSSASAQYWNNYSPFVPMPAYSYRFQYLQLPTGTFYQRWYATGFVPTPVLNPFFNPVFGNGLFNPYLFPQAPIVVQPPAPVIVQAPAPVIINGNIAPAAGDRAAGGGGIAAPAPPLAMKKDAIPADIRPPAPALGPAPAAPMLPVPPAPKAEEVLPDDLARLLEAGRKAFAEGQYGRATEIFRRATELHREAIAYYLLAQSQFALGKYRESVGTISAGMTLRANWADLRVNTRGLYGKKALQFDEQLRGLRDAVDNFRDEASLQFLLGHQLWFDGKADEAKVFLKKAQQAGADVTPAAIMLAGIK